MKKTFTSLLALAGMVAGFTLTSCGGGGGGGENFTGDQYYMTSTSGVNYYLQIDERVGASDMYRARLYSGDRSEIVEIALSLTSSDGQSATFTVGADSWEIEDRAGFVTIFTGTDVNSVVNVSIAGIQCTIKKEEKEKGCSITWVIPADSYYKIEDDTKQHYFAWEMDDTVDPPVQKAIEYNKTHMGTLAY